MTVEQENPLQDIGFNNVEIESARQFREDLLKTLIEDPTNDDLVTETYGKFSEELQEEANEKFSDGNRDLWVNLQLTKVFIDAQMWENALDFVDDSLLSASNMQQGEEIFQKLREEILEKINNQQVK